MKKILVTTDFSANSKAGLRFAIQLASQNGFELTFFHSYYILKPTSWTETNTGLYEQQETDKIQKKLNEFVASVYKTMNATAENMKCVVQSSIVTDSNIIEYAQKNEFSFICISTRGAGTIKKIFGTNTSILITHSIVPVISVPHNYRSAKITSVLYASDLNHIEQELKKVVEFTKPLNATVELLHFSYPSETDTKTHKVEDAIEKFSNHNIIVHFENVDFAKNLVSNIEKAVKKSKPSVMIMFTEQNRNFFEKIFLSSKSAEYSFNAKIPLLVFNKI
jgi:nucleotide-binding universal stress UspA family protein